MKRALMTMMGVWAMGAGAYCVKVDTVVANAGRQVTVPVRLDTAAGLSYAGAQIAYDPQVLVVTKVEAGTLKAVMGEDFTAADTNGVLSVAIFGSADANVVEGSGSIAEVTFAVREGTAGLYTDLAVSDVQLGERTGVVDVTADAPCATVNGMVRVLGEGAAAERLENAQTIAPETKLGSLKLEAGDAIAAAGSQKAIEVAGAVESAGAIRVAAPREGWGSGRYELLKTTTAGLAFVLEGTDAEVAWETAGGVTTYYAVVTVAGETPVECAGEALTAAAKNQIRARVSALWEGKTDEEALRVKALAQTAKGYAVEAPMGMAALIADMGIAPRVAGTLDETGTLKLTYAKPELRITSFDPGTGAVRFKVKPGEGNRIVAEIATGYVHVYGTDRLGEAMREIAQVGFDLTPYLREETKGEGVLNVTLGSHSFLRVKIE